MTNPIPDPLVYLDFHPLKNGHDLTVQRRKLPIKTEQVVMMETTKKTMTKMTRNTINMYLMLKIRVVLREFLASKCVFLSFSK